MMVCLFFLLVMISIGVWARKKTITLEDFFLGGRTIGPWMSAVAYGTTYFSAVFFIGFAGKLGWGFGLRVLWIAVGNAVFGSLLAWLILAKRTRRMTQNLGAMTMPEFFQERFGGKHLKMITAYITFIFLLPYSALVFKGLGYFFEANFNISYDIALLVMIAITSMYLIWGGYFAITLADFVQGIVVIVGSLAMLAVFIGKAGGLENALVTTLVKYPEHMSAVRIPNNWMLFALIFTTSFGTWGMPHMVQKFYAVKNEEVITKAAWVTFVFVLIITCAAYFTGAFTHVFYDTVPLVNNAPAFYRLIPDLLKNYLSPYLMALVLLLVLSASMSAFSSLVLVSASSVAIDLYKGQVNPKISKERSLFMLRFLCGVFAAFSYFIARYEPAIIVTLMSLSWGVISGAFMAPYLYGLFWRRTTCLGVKVGMAFGVMTAIGLFFILGPDKSPIASTIAMLVPFLVVPLVSIYTHPPSSEIIYKAFKGT